MSNLPPGYNAVPGTNKIRRTFDSAIDLREVYGLNPKTREPARRYHPWYVSLPVMTSKIIGFSKRQGLFTYAQNETEAMSRCGLFWNKFFREVQGVRMEDFPKLVQYDPKRPETGVVCVYIDDQDFDKFWKECQKHPHYYAGNKTSPVTFCAANDVDIFSLV
jgi:hypothetical protein